MRFIFDIIDPLGNNATYLKKDPLDGGLTLLFGGAHVFLAAALAVAAANILILTTFSF